MGRIRKCNDRCHNAKGNRCKCVCGGFYHGSNGTVNRQALHGMTEKKVNKTLAQAGFKKGETAYIEQKELPLELECFL